MLVKDPDARISAKDACKHIAFDKMFSKSPLVDRKRKDTGSLMKHDQLTK